VNAVLAVPIVLVTAFPLDLGNALLAFFAGATDGIRELHKMKDVLLFQR